MLVVLKDTNYALLSTHNWLFCLTATCTETMTNQQVGRILGKSVLWWKWWIDRLVLNNTRKCTCSMAKGDTLSRCKQCYTDGVSCTTKISQQGSHIDSCEPNPTNIFTLDQKIWNNNKIPMQLNGVLWRNCTLLNLIPNMEMW